MQTYALASKRISLPGNRSRTSILLGIMPDTYIEIRNESTEDDQYDQHSYGLITSPATLVPASNMKEIYDIFCIIDIKLPPAYVDQLSFAEYAKTILQAVGATTLFFDLEQPRKVTDLPYVEVREMIPTLEMFMHSDA